MAPSWPSWPSGLERLLGRLPEQRERQERWQPEPQTWPNQRREQRWRHTRFSLLYGRGTRRSWLHPSNKNRHYRAR
jgi:hypothetical protein